MKQDQFLWTHESLIETLKTKNSVSQRGNGGISSSQHVSPTRTTSW
jgi:hypothetical protein